MDAQPFYLDQATGHRLYSGDTGCRDAIECNDFKANEEIIKGKDHKKKCDAGDDNYCSTAVKHPGRVLGFTATALIGGATAESFILGGGATSAAELAFWRGAQACIGSVVCRWITGMAGGAGATSVVDTQTCGTCGTNRPDLVRNPGALRIDADGASLYCRNCVANGSTTLDPNGKYWIHSFDEVEQQASQLGVSSPAFSGPPDGHFSAFAGAVGQAWEGLNTWIRSGGKTVP